IAFIGEHVRPREDANDGPVLNGELVPQDPQDSFEIPKIESKVVHKILKGIRPKPNLVHQNMMMGCDNSCLPVNLFMGID
ncbi:hypothetical protein AMTR_s00178p00046510, partial [Amborella trichopoda]